jgi:hypothetical protein
MELTNRITGAALVIGLGLSVLPAHAAYVVDLTQVADPSQPLGFDVVATGSGTIDLTDLSFEIIFATRDIMVPLSGTILTGAFGGDVAGYGRITGPASFGSGGLTSASSGSGDKVGFEYPFIYVPLGYTSGSPLSDTSTYDNATFASLGVTPGTYKWTWGTGAHADSFTLDAVVPEPSTWVMMLAGFAGLGLAAWIKGRAVRSAAAA